MSTTRICASKIAFQTSRFSVTAFSHVLVRWLRMFGLCRLLGGKIK
jgi:hypothetical protein